MSESLGRPSRRRPLIIATAITVVVAVGILTVGVLAMNQGSAEPGADASASPQATATPTPTPTPTPTDSDDSTEGGTVEPTPAFGSVLPEAMGGQRAIDALGDDLEAVAARNGKTVEELTELLLRDATAKISTNGFIVYSDSFENEE
ncbi:hypothetical protein [Microbacterium oxydans]|uniref:Uncharacterized protein n=1 Tax=Microbacterium oxydans TaxID=82380 RepID=A0A0F0LBM9_9MICO|nr:hypothetical protein [Microbacterium oxydans]KJL30612.1 hypothetical protein RS83_00681 [Microbacterium oxydans]